jgi:hypothetical protein
MLALAVANGAVREALISPRLGAWAGHVISTITLSAAILLLTWATIGWVRPANPRETIEIGAGWVVLTLAFEFLAGHDLFHNSWSKLLADYSLLGGRVWILVVITTGLAPLIAARLRGLPGFDH